MPVQSIRYADRSRVQPVTAEAGDHLSKRLKRAPLIFVREVEDCVPLFRILTSCPGIPIQVRNRRGSHLFCPLRHTKQTEGPAIRTSNQPFWSAILNCLPP